MSDIPKNKVRQNPDPTVVIKSDLCSDDEPRLARIIAGIPVEPFAPSEDFVKLPPRDIKKVPIAAIAKPFNLTAVHDPDLKAEDHDFHVCTCRICATRLNAEKADKASKQLNPEVITIEPEEAIRREWLLEDQKKKHTPKAKVYGIDLEKIAGVGGAGGSLRSKFPGMDERDVAAFTRDEKFMPTLGQAGLDKVEVEMYRAVASRNYDVEELLATYGAELSKRFGTIENLIIKHAFRIGRLVLPPDFGKKPPTSSDPASDDRYAREREEMENERDRDLRREWKNWEKDRS